MAKTAEKTSQSQLVAVPTSEGSILFPLTVRRMKQLRCLRLHVDSAGQIQVRIPYGVSERQGLDFARRNGDWLRETLAKLPKRQTLWNYLRKNPYITIGGRSLNVVVEIGAGRAKWKAVPSRGQLQIYLNHNDGHTAQLKTVLREIAEASLPVRVATLSTLAGLEYRSVSIRDQRSRWGSCSSTKGLSLNWRLLLLPPALHDHIIWHELTHLSYMDHSERFWRLLKKYDPKTEEHDAEINKLSRSIMGLGR